jgi:hypothetical protein
MLNHYDLGLYIGWFEIPHDFTGLPELWAQVREFDHFGDYFCTCALIIWTVLLHCLDRRVAQRLKRLQYLLLRGGVLKARLPLTLRSTGL